MLETGVNLLTFALSGAVFFVLGTRINFDMSIAFGATFFPIWDAIFPVNCFLIDGVLAVLTPSALLMPLFNLLLRAPVTDLVTVPFIILLKASSFAPVA